MGVTKTGGSDWSERDWGVRPTETDKLLDEARTLKKTFEQGARESDTSNPAAITDLLIRVIENQKLLERKIRDSGKYSGPGVLPQG